MPKILTIDEMLEAMFNADIPTAPHFMKEAEELATRIGESMAGHLKIESDEGSCQIGFGGTCVNFYPSYPNQPIPECMEYLDEGGEWETVEEHEDSMQELKEKLSADGD